MRSPIKILWVATKAPWPPIDGGRLLLWHTLIGLAEAGADLTLVAPADPNADPAFAMQKLRSVCRPFLVARPRSTLSGHFVRALFQGAPVSVARHRFASVSNQVSELLSRDVFDLVQAEQLQAVDNCGYAQLARVPLVLRSQNVESDLWYGLAKYRPHLRPLLLLEAQRLRSWEARAIKRLDATIAVTKQDAARLRALAEEPDKIHQVAAPFPAELPAGGTPPLRGAPAVVLFGNPAWLPNRDGALWFIREIWPAIAKHFPHAVLHVFGTAPSIGRSESVVRHPTPSESAVAYSPTSVLIVPLRIASGVRIKILEAWARGVPVVAMPEAAAGLEAADGRELLMARDADEFITALDSLSQPATRETLCRSARAFLRANHSPAMIAERLLALYDRIITNRQVP